MQLSLICKKGLIKKSVFICIINHPGVQMYFLFLKMELHQLTGIKRTTLVSNDIFNKELIDPMLHKIYKKHLNTFDIKVDAIKKEILL